MLAELVAHRSDRVARYELYYKGDKLQITSIDLLLRPPALPIFIYALSELSPGQTNKSNKIRPISNKNTTKKRQSNQI